MSLIRMENVSKSFSGAPVVSGVSFRVEEGEKIGLIGRNGTGKSTIFRMITGELEPESGVLERMRRARIACLAQIPTVQPHLTLFDIVLNQFRDIIEMELTLTHLEQRMAEGDEKALDEYSHVQDEFHIRGGYDFRARIKQVLTGLGFIEDEFSLPFKALSGGQRTRLMLSLVLLQDADLLLLDEPENHLDLQAREWLETFLQSWPRSFVIISHDRQMLNAVTNRTIEIERGELRSFSGNYDAYVKDKALIREDQQKAFQRQQEFIDKEESWINRFRYKATKARQVQSRMKRLDKLERVEAPLTEKAAASFSLGEVVRSGAVVLDARDLSKAYGDLVLYENITFAVERGERVGIIGPNGTGKTTLLKQLAGKIPAGAGNVILGHKVSVGYYDQQHEDVSVGNDVLTEVMSARPEWNTQQLRSFMGRFLFTGDDVFKNTSTLSGGERSRVAVAKLVLSKANVLLLDEPTNHLDIASREALEGALADFPGSMIIVSHDRALIDRLVTKLIIIENGTASVHLGNYSHYRWKTRGEGTAAEARADEALKIRKRAPAPLKTDRKADERELRKQRKRMETLEEEIRAIEDLVESYEARFAGVDPADYQKLAALTEEYEGLKRDLKEMYVEWESLAEILAQS